jgi:antitoxin component YwqK of YwqJK toxin-antitoxin module
VGERASEMADIKYYDNGNIKSEATYDENGRAVRYSEYDNNGNIIKETDFATAGEGNAFCIRRYEYDENGRMSSINIENHDSSAGIASRVITDYDEQGNIESVRNFEVVENDDGTREETAYDNAGRPIETVVYGYENLTYGIERTLTEYNEEDYVTRETVYTNVFYDSEDGRIIRTENLELRSDVTFEIDDMGRIIRETTTTGRYDMYGEQTERTEYEYGDNGSITKETFYNDTTNSGTVTEYDEDGNRTARTEYKVKDESFLSDNVIREFTFDPDTGMPVRVEETYYDTPERQSSPLKSIEVSEGVITQHIFDNGRETERIEINTNESTIEKISFRYDGDGELKSSTDTRYESVPTEHKDILKNYGFMPKVDYGNYSYYMNGNSKGLEKFTASSIEREYSGGETVYAKVSEYKDVLISLVGSSDVERRVVSETEYDESGNRVSRLENRYDGNPITPSYTKYEFNERGGVALKTEFKAEWINVNEERNVTKYDEDGKVISESHTVCMENGFQTVTRTEYEDGVKKSEITVNYDKDGNIVKAENDGDALGRGTSSSETDERTIDEQVTDVEEDFDKYFEERWGDEYTDEGWSEEDHDEYCDDFDDDWDDIE